MSENLISQLPGGPSGEEKLALFELCNCRDSPVNLHWLHVYVYHSFGTLGPLTQLRRCSGGLMVNC